MRKTFIKKNSHGGIIPPTAGKYDHAYMSIIAYVRARRLNNWSTNKKNIYLCHRLKLCETLHNIQF